MSQRDSQPGVTIFIAVLLAMAALAKAWIAFARLRRKTTWPEEQLRRQAARSVRARVESAVRVSERGDYSLVLAVAGDGESAREVKLRGHARLPDAAVLAIESSGELPIRVLEIGRFWKLSVDLRALIGDEAEGFERAFYIDQRTPLWVPLADARLSEWAKPETLARRLNATAATSFAPGTIALSIVLILLFVVEVVTAHGEVLSISPRILSRLGGDAPPLTRDLHEYWRLLTSGYLHGGLVHVASNVYALLIIGTAIERALGAGWMMGAFVASTISGGIVSSLGNKSDVVAIGASGGIFGLIAMAAMLTLLVPKETTFNRSALVQWLVYGLMLGMIGGFDNWGHVGGILGGALLAFVVAVFRADRKARRAAGVAFGAFGLLLSGATLARAAVAYRHPKVAYDDVYQDDLKKIFDALDKPDEAAVKNLARDLVARQPEDPIARFFAAREDSLGGRCDRAVDIAQGLLGPLSAESSADSRDFIDQNRLHLQLMLAGCLSELGRKDDARAARARFCELAPSARDRDGPGIAKHVDRICVRGCDEDYDDVMSELVDALNGDQTEKARALGAQVAKKFPNDPQAQYFAARADLMREDYDAAIPKLRVAVAPMGAKACEASKQFVEREKPRMLWTLALSLSTSDRAESKRVFEAFCDELKKLSGDERRNWAKDEEAFCSAKSESTGVP